MFKLTCMAFHPFSLRLLLFRQLQTQQTNALFLALANMPCLFSQFWQQNGAKHVCDLTHFWLPVKGRFESGGTWQFQGHFVARFIWSESKVLVYLRRTVSKSQKVHINVRSNIMLKKTKTKTKSRDVLFWPGILTGLLWVGFAPPCW